MTGRLVGIALALAALAGPASARTQEPKSPEINNGDLIKIVFHQMKEVSETGPTAYGPTALPVRRFDAADEPAIVEGVTEIGACFSTYVTDGAARRLLLYFEARGDEVETTSPGEGVVLVAVFDASSPQKLLDLVDVKEDQFTDFGWDGPVSRLGPTTRGFTVFNTHHNSSQGYEIDTVVYVHDGKLRKATDVALLSWRTCKEEVMEQSTIQVRPRRGSPLNDIVVSVKLTRKRLATDCDTMRGRPSVRRYTETYRWNAAKRGYVDAGGTLGYVDRLNRASY